MIKHLEVRVHFLRLFWHSLECYEIYVECNNFTLWGLGRNRLEILQYFVGLDGAGNWLYFETKVPWNFGGKPAVFWTKGFMKFWRETGCILSKKFHGILAGKLAVFWAKSFMEFWRENWLYFEQKVSWNFGGKTGCILSKKFHGILAGKLAVFWAKSVMEFWRETGCILS